jgi:hypothetical protein
MEELDWSHETWIHEVLSRPRFAPYLAKTADFAAAIDLYWWNVTVSAAFYAPLHCLEMALRNAIHRQLAIRWDRTDWWQSVSLGGNGQRMVDDAHRKLTSRSRAYGADDIVAELSFGFWVSLVSKAYDQRLWVPCLHKAFRYFGGSRPDLHRDLRTMLLFRNRIMHHEPIHHRHLAADHQTILRLLGYLSPVVLEQLKPYDQVAVVLMARPGQRTPGS